MELPLFMLEIDELDQTGLSANSFVKMPAHNKSFLTFNGDKPPVRHHFNDEQQIVIGVALSTNQPIYRSDKHNGEYYVQFSEDTGKRIAMKALKTGLINNISLDHNGQSLKGAYMIQSIIVDSKIGISAPEAFADQNLADGSWIVGYKVDDPELWKAIKQKRGFSIEGEFMQELVNNQKITPMKKEKKSKSLFEMIFGKKSEQKFEEATTEQGVAVMWEGDLAEGVQVMVAGEDGEPVPAPAGDHLIPDLGLVITLDEGGVVTAVAEAEAPDEEEFDAEAFKKDVVNTLSELTKKIDGRFDAIEKSQKEQVKAQNEQAEKFEAFQSEVNKDGTKKKFGSEKKGGNGGDTTPLWKRNSNNRKK